VHVYFHSMLRTSTTAQPHGRLFLRCATCESSMEHSIVYRASMEHSVVYRASMEHSIEQPVLLGTHAGASAATTPRRTAAHTTHAMPLKNGALAPSRQATQVLIGVTKEIFSNVLEVFVSFDMQDGDIVRAQQIRTQASRLMCMDMRHVASCPSRQGAVRGRDL